MTLSNAPSGGLLPQGPGKLLISTDFLLEGERVVLRLGRTTDWQAWRDLRSQSRAFLTPWEPLWPADSLTYNAFTHMLEKQWRDWKEDRGYTFLAFLKGDGREAIGATDETAPCPSQARERDEKKSFFSQFGRRTPDFSVMREMSERRPTPSQNHPAPLQKQERKLGPLIGSVALTGLRRGPAMTATLGYWIGAPYARQGLMTEAARLACDFGFGALKLHRIEASCMPENEPSLRLLQLLGFEQEGLAKAALRINGKWEDHAVLALLGE